MSSTTTSPTLPHSPETQRQIAEARTALEASMSNIGSSLDTALRSRAQNLHANSAQLEKQQKDVVKATEGLRKEGEKLRKLADEGSKKIKELGNVQNWAEMLERDFLVLQETVRLANEESDGSWETESAYSGSEDEESDKDAQEEVDKSAEYDGAALGDVDAGLESKSSVDQEGDTQMQDAEHEDKGDTEMQDTEHKDKGKGKEKMVETEPRDLVPEQQAEVVGGSSSATTGSGTDPSSSSVHTLASAVS
jgi:hypothetical protein